MTDEQAPHSEADSSPEPKPRKKRRVLRWLVRLTVLFILTVAAAAVYLTLNPISLPWADERLREAVLEESGMRFEFESADWMLRSGSLVLESPRFFDPEEIAGEPLVGLAALEVSLDLETLVRSLWDPRQKIVVERIVAQGPVTIEVEAEEGRLRLASEPERVLALLREAQRKKEKSEARTRIESLEISGVRIEVDRLEDGEVRLIGGIRDAGLIADFKANNVPDQLVIKGSLIGRGDGSAIVVRLLPDADFRQADIRVSVGGMDSRRHIAAGLPWDFTTQPIEMLGTALRQADGVWQLSAEMNAPRITLIGAGVHGVDHHFERVKLATTLNWLTEQRTLQVESLGFQSRDLTVVAAGSMELFRPYHYDLAVERGELRGRAIDLIEQMVFEEKRIAEANRGRVEVRGRAEGRANVLRPDTLDANFLVEDLALDLPRLPEPIRQLRMTGHVTTGSMELSEAFAFVQGVPINISGSMRGDPLDGLIERAELEWKSTGNVRGLSDLLQEQANADRWDVSFEGDVSGQGKIVVTDADLAAWEELPEKIEYTGRVLFNEATVRSRRLKDPVKGLSGKIELAGASAQLSGLKGSVADLEFAMEGTISGEERLWRNPRMELAVETSFAIERAPEYLAWFDVETPELPELGGRSRVRANISGPADDWRAMQYTGDIHVDDFWIDLESRHIGGIVRAPALELEVTRDAIELPRTTANWEGIDLVVQASVGIDGGTASAESNGELTSYAYVLHKLFRRLEDEGGTASSRSKVTLRRRDAGEKTYANLTEFALDLLERSKAEDFDPEQVWDVAVLGEADLNRLQIRYEAMPEEALIHDVYGRVYYDLDHFWSEPQNPVSLKPGVHAESAQASVDIRYPRGERTLYLDFDVLGAYADLDDWIRKWNKLADKPRRFPPKVREPRPPDVPEVKIHLNMVANRAGFRGVEVRQLSGLLDFTFYRKDNYVLEWRNIAATTREGTVQVAGLLKEEENVKTEEHEIDLKTVRVVEVMQAGMGESYKESGLSSGLLTGTLKMSRSGIEPGGFDGAGRLLVEQSRFVSNAIFRGLGSLIGLNDFFKDITFSRIEGDFTVNDGVVEVASASPMVLENPSAIYPLRLDTHGRIGPEKKLDLRMNLQFFPVVNRIPLVGRIWERIVGRIFKFHVRGTIADPDISMGVPVVGRS